MDLFGLAIGFAFFFFVVGATGVWLFGMVSQILIERDDARARNEHHMDDL